MPDWYVRRNDLDAAFPYAVRLGGCEYSLTEDQYFELAQAFETVGSLQGPGEIQSDGYQDLVIAKGTDKPNLRSLIGLTETKPMRRF